MQLSLDKEPQLEEGEKGEDDLSSSICLGLDASRVTCYHASMSKEIASFTFESIVREPGSSGGVTIESILTGSGGAVKQLLDDCTSKGGNGLVVALGSQSGEQAKSLAPCDALGANIVNYIFSSHQVLVRIVVSPAVLSSFNHF